MAGFNFLTSRLWFMLHIYGDWGSLSNLRSIPAYFLDAWILECHELN